MTPHPRHGWGPRGALLGLLLALLVLGARPALAEQGGGRFTLPLPAGELPDGTLTVKVVGRGMQDLRVGQAVRLLRAEGQQPARSVSTGADGRARFRGLKPGIRYLVQVQVPGREQPFSSAPFATPQTGGVRLLLTLTAAAEPGAHPGSKPVDHPQAAPPDSLPDGHPPVNPADRGAGDQSGAAQISTTVDTTAGQVEVLVSLGKARAPRPGARVTVVTPEQIRKAGARLEQAARLGRSARTDQLGRAVLRLDPKQGQVLLVGHDGLTYRSGVLQPPFNRGLRASFQVFDRTSRSADVAFGEGTHLVSQVGEGALSFMQVVTLVNSGDKLYDPGDEGLLLPLPEGAINLEIGQEYREVLQADPPHGKGQPQIRFSAPVPPGGFSLRYFFSLPYDRAERAFRMRLPLKTGRVMLAFLNGEGLTLKGPDVVGHEKRALSANHSGLAEVFYLRPVAAGGSLDCTIGGLPRRDQRVTWGALALAALLLLWGIGTALAAPRWRRRRQLKRQRLLDELANLERIPADQQLRRDEILGELRGVWE